MVSRKGAKAQNSNILQSLQVYISDYYLKILPPVFHKWAKKYFKLISPDLMYLLKICND